MSALEKNGNTPDVTSLSQHVGVSPLEPVGSKIFGPGTRTRTRLIKIVRPGPGPG
jgi:hypothetical protein